MSELADELIELLTKNEPPLLGPERRPGAWKADKVNQTLDALLNDADLPPPRAALIRSLFLLWHDQLDASHVISQEATGADGCYVHGIMHRREPDYGNAAYWFRRAGDHPIFPALAEQVAGLGEAEDEDDDFAGYAEDLTDGEHWDPFAFIEACEAVENEDPDDPHVRFLREAQSLEFQLLIEHLAS